VVRHLLEVGHDPALIDRVTVEAAAEVVADAAPRHPGERLLDDLALPREATFAIVPAGEQELERGGMGELGRRSKAAVPHVKQTRHLVRPAADQVRAHIAGLRFIERLDDVLADRTRVRYDAIA